MLLSIVGRTRLTTFLAAGALLTTSVSPGPWIPTAVADSKIAQVTKNALYGAGLGLLLGSVTALVVDEDSRDDSIRWGIVLGTFAGFGYGIYSVASGNGDDFFLADHSTPVAGDGFDARTHFVGIHGSWVVDTEAEGDAVTRRSGLLGQGNPVGDPDHGAAFQPAAE